MPLNHPESHMPLFDIDDLIISTARYYTGRCTGLTSTFAEQLAHAWPHLSQATQQIIRRDLERAFEQDDFARQMIRPNRIAVGFELPLGHDEDRAAWELVRQAWQREPTTQPSWPPKWSPPPIPGPTWPNNSLGHDAGAAAAGHAS